VQVLNRTQFVSIVLAVALFAATGFRSNAEGKPHDLILPQDVVAGDLFFGVVELDGHVSVDTVVTLSTNNTAKLSIPASVTVPAGHDTVSFDGTALGSASSVSVTATANGGSATATMPIAAL
jgi:hypothetical protein